MHLRCCLLRVIAHSLPASHHTVPRRTSIKAPSSFTLKYKLPRRLLLPSVTVDGSLCALQRRAPEWEHLGLLGPVVRGAVGDTLLVTFKNMLTEQPVSIHSHGVLYDKQSEGSPYYDGLPGRTGKNGQGCTSE